MTSPFDEYLADTSEKARKKRDLVRKQAARRRRRNNIPPRLDLTQQLAYQEALSSAIFTPEKEVTRPLIPEYITKRK